jgi:ADP-heptose:LPS heptosyltransferase
LRAFAEWRATQDTLPVPNPRNHRLLVIRLDDIGDYLLFRNQLSMYKQSQRWGTRPITLLGNASWKEIFAAFDRGAVDDVIWVDKRRYLTSTPYRLDIWAQLRGCGFETVIVPSRTRPLLLDDLCRLAAAPDHSIGCENTHVHARWNELSDRLYGRLFRPAETWMHEFHFNGQFAAWACGTRFAGTRPLIGKGAAPGSDAGSDLICFIGANTRSRRWPARRWITFIQLYRRRHAGRVILAGSGSAEQQIAARIEAQTDAENIVGKVSLLGLLHRIRSARAVLSNDTMAVHLSVSCGRPTVIVANGVNHQRFTDYQEAGIHGVATVYPRVFTRQRDREPRLLYTYADALTADVASIAPSAVLDRLEAVLAECNPRRAV